MGTDFFAILGLAPGRYEPAEITRRFQNERRRLLVALNDPSTYTDVRRQLDQLHLAYVALRDAAAQDALLAARNQPEDEIAALRKLIAASLEDGLLRYSRRQEILDAAQRLGFSEFQTQLLIAQVQFGDAVVPMAPRKREELHVEERSRKWAAITAATLMALALFLFMLRWVNG